MTTIFYVIAAIANIGSAVVSYFGHYKLVALIFTILSVAAMAAVFMIAQSDTGILKAQVGAATHSLFGGL